MKKISLILLLIFQSILLFGQNKIIPPLPAEDYFSVEYLKNFMNHNRQDVRKVFNNSEYILTHSDETMDEFTKPNSMVVNGIAEDLFVMITYSKNSKKCELIMWNSMSMIFKRIKEELIKLGFHETGSDGLSVCYKDAENMGVCLKINPNRKTLLITVAMPKNIAAKQKQTNQKEISHKK